MNLRYVLFVCLCCCYFSLSAQNVENITIITLNDGSTILGEILRKTAEENVEIKLTSGAQIIIPSNSIKKIKPRKENLIYFSNGKARKIKGYYGFVKTGLLFSKDDYEYYFEPSGTFHTVHGKRFNKKLSAGIGIGIDGYLGLQFIPLYGHVRYEPWNRKIRLYFSADVGYGFPIVDKDSWDSYSGRLFLQPAIGVQFSSRSGGGLFLEWGQKFQWLQRSGENWGGSSYVDDIRLSRVAFTLGYQF